MKITRRTRRNTGIIRLVGPLTAGAGVESLRRLELDLQSGTPRDLVLDLSRVDYVDAAGVGELLRLQRRAGVRGKVMVLAAVPDTVREVLDITRVADEVAVAADVRSAFRLLKTRPAPRHSDSPRAGDTSGRIGTEVSQNNTRSNTTPGYHVSIIGAL